MIVESDELLIQKYETKIHCTKTGVSKKLEGGAGAHISSPLASLAAAIIES